MREGLRSDSACKRLSFYDSIGLLDLHESERICALF